MASKTCKFDLVREDDFVEYFIFPDLKSGNQIEDLLDIEHYLEQVNGLIEKLQRDYIWHKDIIKFTIRNNATEMLADESDDAPEKKESLPHHLYGLSYYGENIQDEWFIVHILFEISKQIPGLVCRVIDSDGEFLLIETAEHLPKWANPETCENRVYIVNGEIHIVQNSPDNTESTISVASSLNKIRKGKNLFRASKDIQSCIQNRITKVLEDVETHNFHNQIVRVPIYIACLLNEHPELIAPVVRSFCNRDSIDMKVCRVMKYFPPEMEQIRYRVRFTRCLYAMLQNAKFLPEKKIGWKLPANVTSEEFKEALLGIKLACGFEILAAEGKEEETDRNWRMYVKNLTEKGYFKENLEGSADHTSLLSVAQQFYKENQSRFQTTTQVGQKIVNYLKEYITDASRQVLRDEEPSLEESDPDDWLNISPEDLEKLLIEKYGSKGLLSANGEINSKEFTENISDFLEKKSDYVGIEEQPVSRSPKVKKSASMRQATKRENSLIKEDNPGDSSINFDADSFSNHVKNLLDFVIPEDKWESNSEMSEYSDDDELERQLSNMANTKMTIGNDIKSYMKQMDKELAQTTVGQSFEKKVHLAEDDDFEDIESFKPIDIDANTVNNLLDSYKSQHGGPGPTSSLIQHISKPKIDDEKASKASEDDISETTV